MNLSKTGCAIIAHRGASADEYENTLASFELAIQQGAEWVECDIRCSADGVIFIHHDPNIGKNVLGQMKFSEIRDLPGGTDIPTLVELLRTLKGRVKFDIELKEPGYEAEVVAIATHYLGYDEIIMTSFLDDVLLMIKTVDAQIRTGLIVGKRLNHQDPLRQLGDLYPYRRVRRIGADMVASHYLVGDIIFRWLLRRWGIPVAMWTINNPRLIQRYLRDPNVIAIITNKPAVALQVRTQYLARKNSPNS